MEGDGLDQGSGASKMVLYAPASWYTALGSPLPRWTGLTRVTHGCGGNDRV